MTDHVQRSAAQLDDEVAEWLFAHDRGLTDQETHDFDAWLAASPAHGTAWAETASLWLAFDEAAADADLSAMLEEAREAQPARLSFLSRSRALVVGSGVALSAALVWMIGMPLLSPDGPKLPAEQIFSTELASAQYHLSDGTKLTLDAGSTMSFAVRGGDRIAKLERGRAYLDIHHDTDHPFSVNAAGATITDVGTQFSVEANAETLKVILVSGKVAIADPTTSSAAINLEPGQQFSRTGAARGAVSVVNPSASLAWRDGYVEFAQTPLATAVAEMNRYTDRPLRVGNAATGRLLVSGRFRSNDPATFAQALTLTHPLRLTTDKQGRSTLETK